MKGWRPNSLKQYKCYLDKWIAFCTKHNLNPSVRNDTMGIEFLRSLFKQGAKYQALNTARSSLSAVFAHPPFGSLPAVQQFMRGVYNLRPNFPRYHATWDVAVVLKYLENCSPARFLSLQQLSHKLATLLALVTGQRMQTLHALNLSHCSIDKGSVKFHIQSLMKHSRPSNKTSNEIVINSFNTNKRICPVFCLKHYIQRTKLLRQDNQLFVNCFKPHKPISKDTLSRWVKLTLTKAGINTTVYKAHSTRSASTSAAAATLDISTILKAASWTNAATFNKHYRRVIPSSNPSFGTTILKTL